MYRGLLAWSCCCVFFVASASAQDCGVWLPGPKTPDFPDNLIPIQFVSGGGEIYARVRNLTNGLADLWRFDGNLWHQMPWDRSTMGSPDAITFENNQLAVASQRRIGPGQTGFINWDITVRTWDGADWQTFDSLTEQISAQCDPVELHPTDLCFLSDAWYVSTLINSNGCAAVVVHKAMPNASTRIGIVNSSFPLTQVESYIGQVYLAGSFTSVLNGAGGNSVAASNIAFFNGSIWQGVAGGTDGEIFSLAVWSEDQTFFSTKLVAAGKFTHAGAVAANGIAAWSAFDGLWHAFGSGVTWIPTLPFSSGFHGPAPLVSLPAGINHNDLVIANILGAGGDPNIISFGRWTGSAWQPFGAGGFNTGITGVGTGVAYNGEYVAGGGFSAANSGGRLYHVGRFDGSEWHNLGHDGTDAAVRALFQQNGVVYAGGDFTTMDSVPSAHVAQHTASGWSNMGSGINGPVFALNSFNGEIIAGGSFQLVGGGPPTDVAAWNGSSWHTLGAGLDNIVYGLTVWNNLLVAVGGFHASAQNPMVGVAVWNGTTWSRIGPGGDLGVDCYAVTVHDDELYVGGDFQGGIVRWTGTQWQVVGGGTNGRVRALASLAGSLYVGGEFTSVGSNQLFPFVARWTGSQWLPLRNANGTSVDGPVYNLTPATDQLFVGGQFGVQTTSGVARYVARWDGVRWVGTTGIPPGAQEGISPDARVYGSTLDGSTLWVGGDFLTLRSPSSPDPAMITNSAFVAQWRPVPALVAQPESQFLCQDNGTATAKFSAILAAEPGLTLKWQKGISPMNPVNDGLRITGSTTNELTIFNVVPADAGQYRLKITDPCGQETLSDIAVLSFDGCCDGDLNGDTVNNLADVKIFVACEGGPNNTNAPQGCTRFDRADIDEDHDADLRDFAGVQNGFRVSCP